MRPEGATRPAIVITADAIHPEAAALLAGYDLVYAGARASEKELAKLCAARQPVALLVRYGQVSAQVMAASVALKVIARHGVGLDNVDLDFARRHGIAVLPALGSNNQAVAELTIGLILACARSIPWLDQRMRAGHWDKEGYSGIELQGRILGLIGFGAIGRRVADLARSFGLRLLATDPYVPAHLMPFDVERVDLPALLRRSDIVSLHCPLNDETRGMIDAATLAEMKPGVILINAARNGLVDEAALVQALSAGALRAAALDCFDREPLPPEAAIRQAPNLVLTPHIAGTTDIAWRNMGVFAARHILAALAPSASAAAGNAA